MRAYNRHQQALLQARQTLSQLSTHGWQTDLPNSALFVSLLEQRRGEPSVLMVSIPTLQEAMGVLNAAQREQLMATLVTRLRGDRAGWASRPGESGSFLNCGVGCVAAGGDPATGASTDDAPDPAYHRG